MHTHMCCDTVYSCVIECKKIPFIASAYGCAVAVDLAKKIETDA